jgi:phosphoglycolate phosphatase-like HAD superfamily hydrolase
MLDLHDTLGRWNASETERTGPELLVADLESTAIRDSGLVGRTLLASLQRFGCPAGVEDVVPLLGSPTRVLIAQVLVTYLAHSLESAFRLAERVEADFCERILGSIEASGGIPPTPGAENAFAVLQSEGVRIVLDSALPRRVVDFILARNSWLRSGLVDAAVAAEEVGTPRPSPELIRQAIRRALPGGSARVAKLASCPGDLAAAHSAGCRWILAYSRGPVSAAALRLQSPTHVIECLGEVSEALIGRVLR